MPPRYAYWTILIDGKPTAFRARDREELLPTLAQLRRTSPQTEMRWFAGGRLWDSPEQAQWARKQLPALRERRDRDWRPGGEHKDPRARFDKERRKKHPHPRRETPADSRPSQSGRSDSRVASTSRPPARPQGRRPPARPSGSRPPGASAGNRPPGPRPAGRPAGNRPPGRATGGRPSGRPNDGRPAGRPPGGDRGPRGPRRRN